jgi:hypothetical protein
MKLLFTFILSFLFSLVSYSQQTVEGALIGGASYYHGDLDEGKFVSELIRPNLGAALRFNLRPWFIFKVQAMFGRIAGNDKYTDNEESRGAYFENNYFSLGLAGEVHPWRNARFDNSGEFQKSFSPYFSFGAEYLSSADDADCRHCKDLDSYALPEKEDKDSFLSIPVGIGARYDFHPNISVGIEAIFHYVLSDYLDGVSKLGNPDNKDWMAGANLYISYYFGRAEPSLNF